MGCAASENVNNELVSDSLADNQYDYRHHIIKAYIHSIKSILKKEREREIKYDIFLLIPTTINDIIEKYYLHYEIYNISINDRKIRELSELEYIVYNCSKSNIFYDGNNKLYIKDTEKRMHAFIETETDNDEMDDNNNFIWNETYCFNDFMCGVNEIELIKHSLFNINRKIIKLKNGSIYTQYIKNANGWSNISKLKRINIIDIDCGEGHTLFLTSNGQVYSQGNNNEGQCGIVKTKNGIRINDTYITTPTLIDTFIQNNCNIKSISCGYGHNVCIEDNKNKNKNNKIWMFGRNKVWQCAPKYINNEEELYLPRINKAFLDTNVIKARCGNDVTVLLSEKGFLYGLGNINGQINLEIKGVSLLSIKNNIKDFECSNSYVIWVTNTNKIYSLECKQSWWYGWNRNRTFTQDWNSNKPIYWNSFKQKHHRIIVGKHNFILFTN
eukprot:136602_1